MAGNDCHIAPSRFHGGYCCHHYDVPNALLCLPRGLHKPQIGPGDSHPQLGFRQPHDRLGHRARPELVLSGRIPLLALAWPPPASTPRRPPHVQITQQWDAVDGDAAEKGRLGRAWHDCGSGAGGERRQTRRGGFLGPTARLHSAPGAEIRMGFSGSPPPSNRKVTERGLRCPGPSFEE